MRGTQVKRIRRAVWCDESFRTRQYGVKPSGELIEVGRRGFERRMRRGTLDLERLAAQMLQK